MHRCRTEAGRSRIAGSATAIGARVMKDLDRGAVLVGLASWSAVALLLGLGLLGWPSRAALLGWLGIALGSGLAMLAWWWVLGYALGTPEPGARIGTHHLAVPWIAWSKPAVVVRWRVAAWPPGPSHRSPPAGWSR